MTFPTSQSGSQQKQQPSSHWDIFCTVIDNYGDIGVTWRLAKQLADDFNIEVNLWVDDLHSFSHILPKLCPQTPVQCHQGVTIIHWTHPLPINWQPGLVLIEAFACELPQAILSQLEQINTPPTWINLEYLSAESWIDDCHGLPSLQSNAIAKHFFFPGFSPKSGGLLCEHHLLAEVTQWQASAENRENLLASLSIEGVKQDDTLISVFSYESPALQSLCQLWQQSIKPVHALIPMGRSLNSLSALLPIDSLAPGMTFTLGALTIHILPMTDQDTYDRLLWSCDFNIVRGEDSFIRAQWAMRPFIWHIYAQENDIHLDKLSAFTQRYCKHLEQQTAKTWTALNVAFNQDDAESTASKWQEMDYSATEMQSHIKNWPVDAINDADLATRLVQFVKKG
ncbi:elongation factor P maturation arginine rhamnosyltransferase EarP [Shewanella eurypsychrophilus]|uniref:Protein-arginine rhamnosyltransferase n=1 Tax=Shewanella eurypsychrophilus TaxID=2593656 RepID=A0ABX6V8A7_9GAMM|nr:MULTISPECIES: elongation factor P maturation arginine rhamnosyltransferase EarP [Shewanella]QFU22924.1 elongation factor P maturation arginine rhamnosyltransferase EarP [Shewanella sp. YLB-09]QPG58210.1 elongation factor P maturation arginine rhamnosyltransferase EarP [Shewanella eurypsychrophilus]